MMFSHHAYMVGGWPLGPILAPACIILIATIISPKKTQTHRPAAGPAALLDEGPAAMIF